MSINDILPTELARHRQNVNPAKVSLPSAHGDAYLINRNRAEAKEMAVISAPVDSEDYFNELLKDGY